MWSDRIWTLPLGRFRVERTYLMRGRSAGLASRVKSKNQLFAVRQSGFWLYTESQEWREMRSTSNI
ncbi:MAG: hypothetical protein HC786_22940 [Richelia sp. CSU_2_1]|nr:hypothetical protein [Richelia sp. CSU_2_1]